MFEWLPAPALVLCDAVSVIAGVRHPHGVVLMADRGAVDPAHQLTPGVPVQHGEQSKLVLVNTGVAVAVAGLRTPPGEQVDLLDVCRRATESASGAPQAAIAIEAAFDRHAHAFRRAGLKLAEHLPPFEVPVLSVALVAGPSAAGPDLRVVGLTITGASVQVRLVGPGAAYGPVSCRADLALGVTDASGLAMIEDAATRMGQAFTAAFMHEPGLVSADYDSVAITPAGVSQIHRHTAQRRPIGPH